MCYLDCNWKSGLNRYTVYTACNIFKILYGKPVLTCRCRFDEFGCWRWPSRPKPVHPERFLIYFMQCFCLALDFMYLDNKAHVLFKCLFYFCRKMWNPSFLLKSLVFINIFETCDVMPILFKLLLFTVILNLSKCVSPNYTKIKYSTFFLHFP